MAGFSIVRSLFLILHLASGPSSAFVIGRSSTRSWFPRSRRAIATKATVGSIVEIDCTLRPEGDFVPDMLFDGIALDESDEPKRLKFCLGQGNYVPGLHDLVLSMEVGEIVKDIRLDAGWGDWNPALNVSISLEALEGNGLETTRIKVGTELLMANGMRALVTHRSDNAIVVDANPPLSGASYLATVKLLAANDGPKDLLYAAESGSSSRYQVATVALGCFWGAELAYMREPGVVGTKGMMDTRRVEGKSYIAHSNEWICFCTCKLAIRRERRKTRHTKKSAQARPCTQRLSWFFTIRERSRTSAWFSLQWIA